MRIKTNIYERKSQTKEPYFKHFLVFEGEKTKQIYFDEIVNTAKYINSKIFFFLRDQGKEGWSNPQKIMELIEPIIKKKKQLMSHMEPFMRK